jgi:hypothetical protein
MSVETTRNALPAQSARTFIGVFVAALAVDDQSAVDQLDPDVVLDVDTGQLQPSTTASSPSLTNSAAELKPVSGLNQSSAAAGPKNSRSQRSVFQAGGDHSVRLLMCCLLDLGGQPCCGPLRRKT